MTIDRIGIHLRHRNHHVDRSCEPDDQFPASKLPQALPFQISPRAPIQFFVTKVNTNAPRTGSIAYSTYFGGRQLCHELLTADCRGRRHCGRHQRQCLFHRHHELPLQRSSGCSSTDFPILNAYQPCLDQAPPVVITNPPLCTYSRPRHQLRPMRSWPSSIPTRPRARS